MRLHPWFGIMLLSCAPLSGCGGGEEQPPKMATPEETQPPVNSQTAAGMADVTPQGAPTSAANAASEEPKKPAMPIELKAAEPSASPDPMPKVAILAPKADEAIPADKAANYEVKLDVKDWPVAKEGPHVHLILDNKPYKAIYEPKASIKLSEVVEGEPEIKEGHHVLVAFPSRQTHESVKPDKGKKPFVAVSFWVGKRGTPVWKPTDPTLVYSRPKGENAGHMADPLMIDFYLLNAELGEGKASVKATVTPAGGEPKSMTTTKWAPLHVTGLPNGETKVHIELLDKDGKIIPGPFNVADRVVTVKRDAK